MPALVVLIEDNPLVRLGQSMLLKDWGYDVIADASLSAVKASLKGATGEIAAIITDYHLGDSGTGPDAALALAKDVGTSIPTLVLSASLGRSSGQAAALHGFDMLEKPVDPERLRGWLALAIRCAA